jgi:hypothetical protein
MQEGDTYKRRGEALRNELVRYARHTIAEFNTHRFAYHIYKEQRAIWCQESSGLRPQCAIVPHRITLVPEERPCLSRIN